MPNSRDNATTHGGVNGERMTIALLTGGEDLSYAQGLAMALASLNIRVDFIGSDKMDVPAVRSIVGSRFLNLRGDQSEDVSLLPKALRVVHYYLRLLGYAVVSDARVFHILWNNKFEFFDRTLLMLFYRMLGKKVVLTVHNVNAAARDGRDSWLNRWTLRVQYRLASHLFVHTDRMKEELSEKFLIARGTICVIPFGINETAPNTDLGRREARRLLGVVEGTTVGLFFGQIAPYKGLEFLIAALPEIVAKLPNFSLVIAGKVKRGHEEYWSGVEKAVSDSAYQGRVDARIGFVPDEQVEIYFKACDMVVLPYVQIYQSGVPFLAYAFGCPVVVTNVGSLADDVEEGVTGSVCEARDPASLARAIVRCAYASLQSPGDGHRTRIMEWAREKSSWRIVAEKTAWVYAAILQAR